MKKICFLGLSGSGKTCYLYAASHLLGQGLHTSAGKLSIVCADTGRSTSLTVGFNEMNGKFPVWPKGTGETMYFPFELFIEGRRKIEFEICDYRGGVFSEATDKAHDQRQTLYEESDCIVLFIDSYTLMRAFSLKNKTDISNAFKRGDLQEKTYSDAISELNHLKVIINEARRNKPLYHEYINELTEKGAKVVAIGGGTGLSMLLRGIKKYTNNKKLFAEELEDAIEKLKLHMDILFSEETLNPIGITAISLGTDLGSGELNQDGQKKILGQMHLSVSNNLHIPILFPLFIDINLSDNEKGMAKKIFNSNSIQIYFKGKPALISF